MRIDIAERLRPFSHLPGTMCILPGSFLSAEVFPEKFTIFNLEKIAPASLGSYRVNVRGPVKDFTVELDLEKALIKVWGNSQDGFFRYLIRSDKEGKGFSVSVEKTPASLLISPDAPLLLKEDLYVPPEMERLYLGVSKKQDSQLIKARCSLAEFLPIWFRLGQLLPHRQLSVQSGTARLLKTIGETIKNGAVPETSLAFQKLFLAGTKGIFFPRLKDDDFQGFQLPDVDLSEEGSPLFLLSEGAALIRSMFIQQEGTALEILPHLLSELPCGRMTQAACSGIGKLNLEWRKQTIRRMELRSAAETELRLTFPKGIKRYRLREGTESHQMEAGVPIKLFAEKEYLFDNFQ